MPLLYSKNYDFLMDNIQPSIFRAMTWQKSKESDGLQNI